MDFTAKQLGAQSISWDKLNMLRHVRFFKNADGIWAQLDRHAALLRPKFDAVLTALERELGGTGAGTWVKPKGGYFVTYIAMPGCAKRIVALCREAGVVLTDAGATHPYHKDPDDSYIRLAEKMHSELAGELAAHRSLLYQAQQEYNAAIDSLPNRICISDGDMDCKNVLWKNGEPFIIDLECLDYGNPFPEMLQLALSWAGGDVCSIDPGRLHTFLTAYRAEYGEIPVDWKMLSGAGYSWLDWLEYNTKRALRIECGDEEEQRLGLREAQETIRRIDYYQHVREKIFSTG